MRQATELKFKAAIDEFFAECIADGDLLEDVVDNSANIVGDKITELFDKNPIPLCDHKKSQSTVQTAAKA